MKRARLRRQIHYVYKKKANRKFNKLINKKSKIYINYDYANWIIQFIEDWKKTNEYAIRGNGHI